jgi:uncharacterized protein (DUF362 family)
VSIVKGFDVDEVVTKAIDLLGGMDTIVKESDCVVLKPNITAALPPETGVATDPKILEVLARLAYEAGAKEVVIAEGSGSNDLTDMPGLAEVAQRTGAKLFDINQASKNEIVNAEIPNPIVLKEIPVPRLLLEADVVINVPKMKTTLMRVSLGLKNLVGVTPGKGEYAEWSGKVPRHPFIPAGGKKIIHSIRTEKGARDGLSKAIVDLSKLIHCDATVIDGIYAMEGMGPIHGAPVKMGVIIAGRDIVAVDAVGAAVMGFNPAKIEHIRLAAENGIGICDLDSIEICGESIKTVYRGFASYDLNARAYYKVPPERFFQTSL